VKLDFKEVGNDNSGS